MNLLQRLAAKLISRDGVGPNLGNLMDSSRGWNIIRGDMPTIYQNNGKNVRIQGWERHPVVMACCRIIAELVASVPFEIYTKNADDQEIVVPGHELGRLLENPTASMSGFRFRLLSTLHYLIYGNIFWALDRNTLDMSQAGPVPLSTEKPSRLHLIHPERLMYVYTDAVNQEPYLWDWRDRNGIMHRSIASDICHVADMSGADWIFGYPRAAAALQDIITDNEASNYVRNIVKNDGSPSLVLLMDQDAGAVTREELTEAAARWHDRARNRGELGRAQFVSSVKEVKQLGFNLKQLEFPGLRAIAREDICAVFGIDPRMVGIASAKGSDGGLSGQQYVEARFRLIQQTILPTMKAIEAELNGPNGLSPEYGNVFVRFSRVGLSELTEDETDTWTRASAALVAGGITREEFRDMIGFDEKMEDDEHIMVPSTTTLQLVSQADEAAKTRLDQLKNPPTPPALNGNGTPNGAIGDAKTPKQLPAGKPANTAGSTADRAHAHPGIVTRSTVMSPELRATAWSHLDKKASGREPAYERAAKLRFAAEAKSIASILAQVPASRDTLHVDPHIQEAERRILNNYRSRGEYYKEWLAAYKELTAETVTLGGADLAATLGLDFNLSDPQLKQIVDQRATQLADYVTKTTAESIKAAMDVGLEQGMGVHEIADLIQASVFGEMSDARAEMIARTEVIGTLNESAYTTAQLSKVVDTKEWLTQGDERVRDSHAAIDGQVVGIDETFDNGLEFPGDQNGDAEDVINCRCGMLFHTDTGDTDADIEE